MRQVCTPENPCDGKGQWVHPEAKEVGEQFDDLYSSYVKYKCPVCGKEFEVELPD